MLVKVVQAALLQLYEGSSILQTSGCYVLCTLTAVKQPYQTTVYDLPIFANVYQSPDWSVSSLHELEVSANNVATSFMWFASQTGLVTKLFQISKKD